MVWTQAKEKTKEEIEARLKVIGGDMLKVEYLGNCLKQQLDFNVRRFVHLKLADIYKSLSMHDQAARNIDAFADLAATFKDKSQSYMQEVELWVKYGDYDKADEAFKKASACASLKEKEEIKQQLKKFFLGKAYELERMHQKLKYYQTLPNLRTIWDLLIKC